MKNLTFLDPTDLLCTLFTGSLSIKNIENNFSPRLLAPVKLRVRLGCVSPLVRRSLHFRMHALDIRSPYSMSPVMEVLIAWFLLNDPRRSAHRSRSRGLPAYLQSRSGRCDRRGAPNPQPLRNAYDVPAIDVSTVAS